MKIKILSIALSMSLVACGGGNDVKDLTPTPAPTPAPTPSNIASSCIPGSGVDYQVGEAKSYTALEQVPWERLQAGDTVRIFYKSSPYKGKLMISGSGTAVAPIRVCGVKGPNGERPEIDGNGAISRSSLDRLYGASDSVSAIHQARSIIVVKQLANQPWDNVPSNIQIDGLAIRKGHPNYTFIDTKGLVKNYSAFGGCIWIERGHNITIKDNEISDCQMAVFTKSTDEGEFAQSKNINISQNYMWGHGIVGSFLEHTTYTQGINMTIEGNTFGPLRAGALGNSLKDRSIGTIIRYNFIEQGAHSLDLVEAEDFPNTAAANADYRKTFVYGNILKNSSSSRAIVHYGGDHFGSVPGANWGEDLFRKGNLYFFNNTVIGSGNIKLFRVSTTDENVLAWNNIFWSDGVISIRTLENDTVGSSWIPDGAIALNNNFIKDGFNGQNLRVVLDNNITGALSPINLQYIPQDINIINKGINLTQGANHPINKEIGHNFILKDKMLNGLIDLGAIEK